jgi:hypothetical protein
MEVGNKIREIYREFVNRPSDINEHLPTLYQYSKDCEVIAECGVRSMVSTWAFLQGLLENAKQTKQLFSVDIADVPNVDEVINFVKSRVDMKFIKHDSATVELPEVDLLFIDTWHIYGHLKRELAFHHAKVRKYIIMHDTHIDGEIGESIRCNSNIGEQSKSSGYSIYEIITGLQPAIREFLGSHPEWILEKEYKNNNGLTILKRVN